VQDKRAPSNRCGPSSRPTPLRCNMARLSSPSQSPSRDEARSVYVGGLDRRDDQETALSRSGMSHAFMYEPCKSYRAPAGGAHMCKAHGAVVDKHKIEQGL
jgi:hypothetical protein